MYRVRFSDKGLVVLRRGEPNPQGIAEISGIALLLINGEVFPRDVRRGQALLLKAASLADPDAISLIESLRRGQ